jgi:hypothetical protein
MTISQMKYHHKTVGNAYMRSLRSAPEWSEPFLSLAEGAMRNLASGSGRRGFLTPQDGKAMSFLSLREKKGKIVETTRQVVST